MTNNIAISALLRTKDEVIHQRNEAVRSAAKPYDTQLSELDLALNKLTDTPTLAPISTPPVDIVKGNKRKVYNSLVYPLHGTVLAKLLFIIKEVGRFITISEIAAFAKTYENISEIVIKDRFSKHMNKYKNQGIIYSYQVGSRRNMVYGLPEWVKSHDGKEMVSEYYKHNEDALIDRANLEPETIFD